MLSKKPTHGLPLTDEEKAAPRDAIGGKWRGGPRFQWVSHFGSKASNTGSRTAKAPKPAGYKKPEAAPRLTIVPGWARKYINE